MPAGDIKNLHERQLLDHSLGTAELVFDGQMYLALFKGDPGEAGSILDEVDEGGYARQAVDFTAAATDGSDNSTAANSADVVFGPFSANVVGNVTHVGIMTEVTGGEMRWSGAVAVAKSADEGDEIIVREGDLTCQLQ